jgi:hypothetical protein
MGGVRPTDAFEKAWDNHPFYSSKTSAACTLDTFIMFITVIVVGHCNKSITLGE